MHHIAETFRALHVKGDPLTMINVWDAGTARMMQAMGAKALATSSAAHAYVLGRVDGGTISRDDALSHAADIVAATDLPVQGDFENGFGDTPEDCAETVRLAAEVGLAGICIEDLSYPSFAPYAYELAVERMQAAAAAARMLGHDFVLTARADGVMVDAYDTDEAIRRLQGFEAAGVDCLYAPMPPAIEDLKRICSAVSLPVNVLAAGRFAKVSRAEFGAIGAARISIGSAMARVTHQAIHDAAQSMINDGDFSALTSAMSGDVVDAMIR